MHWKALFKGEYITGEEMGEKEPVLTIANVKQARLEGEDGKVKDRCVVTFSEIDRGWVVCKTNAMCLAAMFGDHIEKWQGRKVKLFATQVQVGKEQKIGIRVRGGDIESALTVPIKLPKKKAFSMTLAPLAPKAAA